VVLFFGCGCLALRPALRPAFQRRPLVMCENPVQDPADLKAALRELRPVLAAKQADGSAYLQEQMKLTPNREKNDELLEQVAACGVVWGGGVGSGCCSANSGLGGSGWCLPLTLDARWRS
jgi:hypothetical protein